MRSFPSFTEASAGVSAVKAIGVWPGDGRLDRRGRAVERHVNKIKIVREAEQLAGKVRGRTEPGPRSEYLPGLALIS